MIPVPPELESHLRQAVTSHCFCWIIRRGDGAVLGFTDHDRALVVDGVGCEPMTGLSGSEASTALGLSAAGGEVEGALTSGRIDAADIEQGRYDGAAVEAWLANWAAPAQAMLLRRWTAGRISRSGGRFVMELKGAAAAFDAVRGRRVLRRCDAMLGDARCGVNASDPLYRGAGTVTEADAALLRVTGLEAYADGWFSEGRLTFTTGDNAGRSSRVLAHAGGRLRLDAPPVTPPEPGDGFEIVAGCDKSFSACKARFGNGVNFRGFPHLPGNDAAYAYVGGGQDYDGSALVP